RKLWPISWMIDRTWRDTVARRDRAHLRARLAGLATVALLLTPAAAVLAAGDSVSPSASGLDVSNATVTATAVHAQAGSRASPSPSAARAGGGPLGGGGGGAPAPPAPPKASVDPLAAPAAAPAPAAVNPLRAALAAWRARFLTANDARLYPMPAEGAPDAIEG